MSSPVASIRVSLRNILLASDFSPCPETALTYGAGLSRVLIADEVVAED